MIPFYYKRDELIAKLKSMIKTAETEDQKAVKKYNADMKKYHEAFKKSVQSATKWDYETAKKNDFYVYVAGKPDSYRGRKHPPRCPESVSSELKHALLYVEASPAKLFTITSSGVYYNIYKLLTAHLKKPEKKLL